MEKKIKIVSRFTINKIKSLQDRNRQLEENITSLLIKKQRDSQLIEEYRREIKNNIDRINKLQKRFGVENERKGFRTQFRDRE